MFAVFQTRRRAGLPPSFCPRPWCAACPGPAGAWRLHRPSWTCSTTQTGPTAPSRTRGLRCPLSPTTPRCCRSRWRWCQRTSWSSPWWPNPLYIINLPRQSILSICLVKSVFLYFILHIYVLFIYKKHCILSSFISVPVCIMGLTLGLKFSWRYRGLLPYFAIPLRCHILHNTELRTCKKSHVWHFFLGFISTKWKWSDIYLLFLHD